jgi:ATP-dependent DNA helicase RecG
VDPTEPAIRDAPAGGKGLSAREIAAVIGSTPRATRTRLVRLVEGGVVREIDTSPQDPKRRYFRTGST